MPNRFSEFYDLDELKKMERKNIELISKGEYLSRTTKILFSMIAIGFTVILYLDKYKLDMLIKFNILIAICYLFFHEMIIIRTLNDMKLKHNFLQEDMGKVKNNEKEQVKEINHFDRLVKINVNNLEEYYELVKKSNSKSFYTALIMSIIGVGIILFGVIKGINNQGNFNSLAVTSGLIVEIISGLLFYLYNRTIIQLKDYHDSLINVQNVLLSFKVIEQITDENKKSEVLKQMIDGLITRK